METEIADLAKDLFALRNRILIPDEFAKLMKQARSDEENVYFVGLYNLALRIKQNEVMRNERY